MVAFRVGPNESGQRMDRLISRMLPKASWGEIQKLFRKKVFKRNAVRSVRASDYVADGDLVEIFLSAESLERLGYGASPEAGVRKPEERSEHFGIERIKLFEDSDYLVVSKPAGMLVHSNDRTSDDDLTSLVRKYLKKYETAFFSPATASRLDRGTSGVVIFAKNYQSLKRLNEEMRTHRARRLYKCVVEGDLRGEGEVRLSVQKSEASNRVFVVGKPENGSGVSCASPVSVRHGTSDISGVSGESKILGVSEDFGASKEAITFYRSEFSFRNGTFSLVTVRLHTGRTHQIRVTMAQLGHPIVGDVKYGSKYRRNSPLLHCEKVEAAGMVFESEPEEINAFIENNR